MTRPYGGKNPLENILQIAEFLINEYGKFHEKIHEDLEKKIEQMPAANRKKVFVALGKLSGTNDQFIKTFSPISEQIARDIQDRRMERADAKTECIITLFESYVKTVGQCAKELEEFCPGLVGEFMAAIGGQFNERMAPLLAEIGREGPSSR